VVNFTHREHCRKRENKKGERVGRREKTSNLHGVGRVGKRKDLRRDKKRETETQGRTVKREKTLKTMWAVR